MIPVATAVQHTPVLLPQAASLARDRTRIVDGTAGGGGHLNLFLESGASVIAFDRDPQSVAFLRERYGEVVAVHELGFGSSEALEIIDDFGPDLIFLDLGVSSHQIDDSDRGFSFRPGAPLDMRMGQCESTAAELLNSASESEIAELLHQYADERRSRPLSREIVRRRLNGPFVTSDDLVNAIRSVLGPRSGPGDFARIFQAFRIVVNDEIAQLETALPRMMKALQRDGLCAVISYHSGEDRVVKHMFREWGRACVCPPEMPRCSCRGKPLGTVLTKSPIRPEADEVASNPRSRSAKLRVFRKAS